MEKHRILITEDDRVQREIITDILEYSGYEVVACASAEEALDTLQEEVFQILLTDMKMPGMDGLELLRRARRQCPEMDVVVMTAHATIKTAVTAIKEGAADYLEKPFDKDELLLVVERTGERGRLRRENAMLARLVDDSVSLGNIIGQSEAMHEVYERTRRAVHVPSTILIQGESGTGKELIARHIHFTGPRAKKPFIVVNCAAIPDMLVESELFGHEKGAFTGADKARTGKFELAHGGTLFLDEIGDMRLESQAKLLRVLEDGVVEKVGGSRSRQVDVRVIVATNCDLKRSVSEGTFRKDLYYRLEVLSITMPPLRDRVEDLPLLITHFKAKIAKKLNISVPDIGAEVLEAFRRYRWPGNVRELENTLEEAFILARNPVLEVKDLAPKFQHLEPQASGIVLPQGGLDLEEVEQELIRQALDRSGGRIKEAATFLGMTYKTLQYRLKKYAIDPKGDTVEK
ncbi:MAG: sigma-54-dependent Fis family transcriptional regulator [Candidatus Hydrogenedens sp.]|jgi:DNA-binding NtrC family response regulator|nr:sigma-54-dependent Fis family transcriptional regulator [Candidatus Hydrogenedens sp.]